MADATPTAPSKTPSRRGYAAPSNAPMSSSAAKRKSVVMLGSIKHLQHYYAKASARSEPPNALAKAMPGLGADALLESPDEGAELPPTPSPPRPRAIQPYEDVIKAEEAPTLEEVYAQVEDVCSRWGLVEHVKSLSRVNSPAIPQAATMTPSLSADSFASSSSSRPHSPVPPMSPNPSASDERGLVLSLLTATTQAIRTVQRYVLALPPAETDEEDRALKGLSSLALGDSPLTVRHQSQLAVSTAARPRTSNNKPRMSAAAALERHQLPQPPKPPRDDPLAALRRASVAVLAVLNDMEARYRLPDDGRLSPLPDSFAHDENEKQAPLFSDTFNGDGHLYRADVTLSELRKESDAVTEWIETADRVLTQCAHLDTRTPSLPTTGILAAKRDWPTTLRFTENPLGLVYIVLGSFLPPTLLLRLASPSAPSGDRMAFLDSLADGQLLCVAYNAALRSSKKPFGFIPASSIQDCQAVNASVGRTFRRFENLRVLKAALRLRYGLTLGDEVKREKARSAPPLGEELPKVFDARAVARRDDGWDEMLESLVLEWAECVVAEGTDDA